MAERAASGREVEKLCSVTRVWRAELPNAPWMPPPNDAAADETPAPGVSTPGLREKASEGVLAQTGEDEQ